MPSSSAYQTRFGSLLRAYELVGFTPDRDYRYIEINRALRSMHPNVVANVVAGIEHAGGSVKQDPASDLLTVNDEFTASIVVVRCRTTLPVASDAPASSGARASARRPRLARPENDGGNNASADNQRTDAPDADRALRSHSADHKRAAAIPRNGHYGRSVNVSV
jgi:hypothetical protein